MLSKTPASFEIAYREEMTKASGSYESEAFGNRTLGGRLSFRDLTVRVLSLRVVFTAVFGMGTGVFLQLNHQGNLQGSILTAA